MNEDKEFEAMIQQNPSIKITKNTKGYNWEFKILSNDVEEMDKINLKIMEKVKKWEQNEESQ